MEVSVCDLDTDGYPDGLVKLGLGKVEIVTFLDRDGFYKFNITENQRQIFINNVGKIIPLIPECCKEIPIDRNFKLFRMKSLDVHLTLRPNQIYNSLYATINTLNEMVDLNDRTVIESPTDEEIELIKVARELSDNISIFTKGIKFLAKPVDKSEILRKFKISENYYPGKCLVAISELISDDFEIIEYFDHYSQERYVMLSDATKALYRSKMKTLVRILTMVEYKFPDLHYFSGITSHSIIKRLYDIQPIDFIKDIIYDINFSIESIKNFVPYGDNCFVFKYVSPTLYYEMLDLAEACLELNILQLESSVVATIIDFLCAVKPIPTGALTKRAAQNNL